MKTQIVRGIALISMFCLAQTSEALRTPLPCGAGEGIFDLENDVRGAFVLDVKEEFFVLYEASLFSGTTGGEPWTGVTFWGDPSGEATLTVLGPTVISYTLQAPGATALEQYRYFAEVFPFYYFPAICPDGAGTLALFGFAIAGLAGARRFLAPPIQ